MSGAAIPLKTVFDGACKEHCGTCAHNKPVLLVFKNPFCSAALYNVANGKVEWVKDIFPGRREIHGQIPLRNAKKSEAFPKYGRCPGYDKTPGM